MIKETDLKALVNSRPWIHKGGYAERGDQVKVWSRRPKCNTYDYFMVLAPGEQVKVITK